MSGVPLRLLLVEDSSDDAELLRLELEGGGYATTMQVVTDADGLHTALAGGGWDIVVSDHNLPGFDSSSALAIVREHDRNLPFIIVSGCLGEEAAVEAMKAGADDYIMKGRLGRLLPAVERGLREARLRRDRREALRQIEESEARLRILTGNVPCLVFQLMRGADGGLRVPYLSGRLKSLFDPAEGAATANLLFRPFGPDGEALRALFTAGAPEITAWSGKLQRSGETIWLELRANRCTTSDGVMTWDAVFFDISDQKRAEHEVRDLNRRLRELSAHANSGREQERARIARELHDDLGGSLSALKIDLVMLKNGSGGGPERLDAMIRLTEETVQAVRRICADLHPRILDELGLDAALQWQSQRFGGHTGIVCDYEGELGGIEVGRAAAIALFRIYQEILTNVARHAGARRVTARLREEGETVCLDVVDDGIGIAPERLAGNGSLGLLGMRERVREVGGTVVVGPASPSGTRVTVRVPLGEQGLPRRTIEG